MLRSALAAFCLLIASGVASAAPDTCTFTASGNWSAIGTHPTVSGCDNGLVIEAGDSVVIPNGITITITGNVTQSGAGGITVQSGGTLRHALTSGPPQLQTTLTIGTGGVTCASGSVCQVQGGVVSYGTAPSVVSAPSTLTYLQAGNYTGCGAGPDCTKAQMQWPAATYDTASGSNFDTGIDTTLDFIDPGDVLCFWNPSGVREFSSHDQDACYPVTARTTTQVEFSVRLAPNLPVPTTTQDIITGTTSSDAAVGTRTVTVPSGTFTATSIYGAVGKWLRFQVGGAYEPASYQILSVTDGGGGADTIRISDPRGFQYTYTSGATFSIDYGWQRGDPILVYRPVVWRCATAYACRVVFNGDTTVRYASFVGLKSHRHGGAGYVNNALSWFMVQETQEGTTGSDAGSIVRFEDIPNSSVVTMDHAMLVGGDGSADAINGTEHCILIAGTTTATYNVRNTVCRFHGDDALVTSTGTTATMNVTTFSAQWGSPQGDSFNLADGSAGKLTLRGADLSCFDCTGQDSSGENVFNQDTSNATTKTVISIDGLLVFGIRGGVGSNRFGFGSPIGLPNENVTLRNVMILGGAYPGSTNYNMTFPVMDNFVVRDVAMLGNESVYNNGISADGVWWRNGLITGTTTASTPTSNVVAIQSASAPTSYIENVAVIDNASGHGSPAGFFTFSNVKDGSVFKNITVANSSSFDSATSSYQRAFQLSDATPVYTLQGLLVTNLLRTSTIGLVPGSAAAVTSLTNRDRWCFFNNTVDFSTITTNDLGPGSMRGLPPNFVDPLRKLYGGQNGSLPALYGCGANVRAGITRYMNMHARTGLLPENLGTLGGGGGGGGGSPSRAF